MKLPEIKSIDFSQFHPLDHTLRACKGYPGGRRVHLKYRWEFQWRDKLRSWTLCRTGRHNPAVWYSRDGEEIGTTCSGCEKDMDEEFSPFGRGDARAREITADDARLLSGEKLNEEGKEDKA